MTPRKIAGDESLVATSNNAVQLFCAPKPLPPVGSLLPPLVGKKTRKNKLKEGEDSELSNSSEIEETKVRISERLRKANTLNPMGGIKYV